ncbi:MAG: sensor histidine kinase [Anaerolineae bacterium]
MTIRRFASVFLATPWTQALVEALLVTVVLGFLFLVAGLDEKTVAQGLLITGPAAAFWHAFRLRRPDGRLRRRLALDLRDCAVLSILLSVTLVLIDSLNLSSILPGRAQVDASGMARVFQGRDWVFFPFFVGFSWMCSRTAALVWNWWDRLRRKHLVWDLTNALLTIAVAVAFVLILAGSLFYARFNLIPTQIGASEGTVTRFMHVLVLSTPALAVALLLTLGALAALLPAFALFSYVVARHVTRRLQSLASGTRALRSGRYDTRIEVTSEDEVGQLQEDFNAMADQLAANLREIRSERDRSSALLQERRELIASVSHELRTPVATVQSYLETTLSNTDPALTPDLRRDLEVVQQEVGRLHHLVDDLLALAQAEAGRLSLACAPVDACALVRQAAETMAPLAWTGGRVQVCAEMPEEPVTAWADATRVQQILVNLLHNAIRHTPPGGIVVADAYVLGESAVLRVRDTGEGIAPADLDRIWERFYRSESSQENGQVGAGLGLALVKELAEAMGGSVSVDSRLGEGSTFRVSLPRVIANAPPTQPA